MFGIETSSMNSARNKETSILDLEILSKHYLDKSVREVNIIEIYDENWKYQ